MYSCSINFGLNVPTASLVVPFLGVPYRILNMNHKKELLWSLWVVPTWAIEGRSIYKMGTRIPEDSEVPL